MHIFGYCSKTTETELSFEDRQQEVQKLFNFATYDVINEEKMNMFKKINEKVLNRDMSEGGKIFIVNNDRSK
jgi:hypothetical protein